MAGIPAGLPAGVRLSDHISLGVIARAVPPDRVRRILAETHGGRSRRSWRKLHLAVDPESGEILASELTTSEEGDASLVGPLLDRITGPPASVTADGAYDGEPVYRAVSERQPHPPAAVIIPPRASAVTSG